VGKVDAGRVLRFSKEQLLCGFLGLLNPTASEQPIGALGYIKATNGNRQGSNERAG